MAVFGIPTVHEDDALRAVRAAAEIRLRLSERTRPYLVIDGVPLDVRIGVNSGEVVAGPSASGQRLVTGDTVNTAARLQAAAGPGDIIVGASTFELVRDAVEVEAVGSLALKGKSSTVGAYRLLSVSPSTVAPARRPGGTVRRPP